MSVKCGGASKSNNKVLKELVDELAKENNKVKSNPGVLGKLMDKSTAEKDESESNLERLEKLVGELEEANKKALEPVMTEIDNGQEQKLSSEERKKLEKYMDMITRGEAAFLSCGLALNMINKHKLYREHCKTFKEFIAKFTNFSRAQAYDLMAAQRIYRHLSRTLDTISAPRLGRSISKDYIPQSKDTLIKLRSLSKDKVVRVFEYALNNSNGNLITADAMKEARNTLFPEDNPESQKKNGTLKKFHEKMSQKPIKAVQKYIDGEMDKLAVLVKLLHNDGANSRYREQLKISLKHLSDAVGSNTQAEALAKPLIARSPSVVSE